jgi:hypothetical protein
VILTRLASIPSGRQDPAPRHERFPSQTDQAAMRSAMIGSIGHLSGLVKLRCCAGCLLCAGHDLSEVELSRLM